MALSPVRAAIEARKKAQQNKNLASAQYIKKEAPQSTVNTFASGIKQIRSAQSQDLGVERPLASSASDREAILRARGQKLPVKSTQQATQQPTQQAVQQPQPEQPAEAPGELMQPQQQAETPTMSPAGQIPGIDKQALLNAGVPQEAIDEMMLKYQPQQQALQKVAADQKVLLDETKSSLDSEQKDTEELLGSVKTRKEQLFEEEKQLIDLSAETQKGISEQQYQKSKFLNEQAKSQFDLDMQQTERKQSIANDERETALRRALGAQLGANFSGRGLEISLTERRRGEELLGDLRAKTAIGKAEFSFRAIDIEKEYANNLKSIEVDRRDSSLQNMNRLDDELTSIDQQVLLTRQQKSEAARKAMKDFFDKQEDIDLKSGELVSSAVEDVFKKKKEIEKEKLEREAFSLEQSKALGYFANKFGEPINASAEGVPKPFVTDFNEKLSQQFGHLVDDFGRKILGDDKQPIPYKDFTQASKETSLLSYLNGAATGYDLENLNGSIGTNNYIKTAVKAGSNGGQCGTFVRTRFTTEPGWESECVGKTGAAMASCSLNSKRNMVLERGFKRGQGAPKVGDIVIFDGPGYGSVGHYAIISEIGGADGKTATLTESNLDLKGTVRTDRKVSVENGAIFGFFTPNHKGEVANAQPAFTAPGGASGEGGSPLDGLDPEKISQLTSLIGNEKISEADKIALLKSGVFNSGSKGAGGSTLDIETTQKLVKDDKWKKVEALKTYKRAIENFNNATKNITDFQVLGKNRPILESAWNDLAIAYKNKAELGALAGPDLALVEGVAQKIGVGNLSSGLGFNAFLEVLEAEGKGGVDAIKKGNNINLANVEKELGEVRSDVIGRYPNIKGTNLEIELMKNYTPLSVEEYGVENLTLDEQAKSAGTVGKTYQSVSGGIEGAKNTIGDIGSSLSGLWNNVSTKAGETTQQASKLADQTFKSTQEAISYVQNSPKYKTAYTQIQQKAPQLAKALQGYSPDAVKKFFLLEKYKALL